MLHCKLKLNATRITTFVTNLSRSKIQCCKSTEFFTYCGWSIVCNWRWFLLSDNLAVIFFLIFRSSDVLSVWSSVSFQIARRKVVFLRQFFQAFWRFCCLFCNLVPRVLSLLRPWERGCLFRIDKRSVPKPMIAVEVLVQGEFMILIFESFWST